MILRHIRFTNGQSRGYVEYKRRHVLDISDKLYLSRMIQHYEVYGFGRRVGGWRAISVAPLRVSPFIIVCLFVVRCCAAG